MIILSATLQELPIKHSTWWLLSALISIPLVVVLVFLWIQMNDYEVTEKVPCQSLSSNQCKEAQACARVGGSCLSRASEKLTDQRYTDDYLEKIWGRADTMHIRTGIFIQSLKFFDSSEVQVTGYLWQRYQDGLHDDILPGPSEVGFVFPEQVNSGSDIKPRQAYRVRGQGETIIGWYFEATLRQPFDYSLYPFDHKTVWVRMWHSRFSENIVLEPDFQAYRESGTAPDDIFGIEEDIVLGTWIRENTYFDYILASYTSDFGIPGYVGQKAFPELRYNFVVKRKFQNAFVVFLLPLYLVAALLFAALLTVSADEKISGRLGFSASGFIGACSALFFVVMLPHIQLRQQFGGSGVVYIEYFYILMYGLLVVATANTLIFSIQPKRGFGIILFEDNLVVKLAYWPVVLICLILITLAVG